MQNNITTNNYNYNRVLLIVEYCSICQVLTLVLRAIQTCEVLIDCGA